MEKEIVTIKKGLIMETDYDDETISKSEEEEEDEDGKKKVY